MKAPRTCPRCQDPLRIEDHDGVILDRCLRCSGIWFDPGELREWGQRQELSHAAELEPGFEPLDPSPLTVLECPTGDGGELTAGEVRFTRIHRCPSCSGCWVPGAQLDASVLPTRRRSGGSTTSEDSGLLLELLANLAWLF